MPTSPQRRGRTVALVGSTTAILVALALSGCGLLGPRPGLTPAPTWTAHAPAAPTQERYARTYEPGHVSAFFEPLSEHGSWREDRATGGWLWRPSDRAFVPFTDGRWVLTEYGPTWVSATPWGWAVEHYGRWRFGHDGWEWAPGTRWEAGPVQWRIGDDVVGWAPHLDRFSLEAPTGQRWSFMDADAFFHHLRSPEPEGRLQSVIASLAEAAYAGWYLNHSRPIDGWGRGRGGAVVARAQRRLPQPTSLSELDPSRTRWQPGWARETVTSSLSRPGVRARPDDPRRRDRLPPVRRP